MEKYLKNDDEQWKDYVESQAKLTHVVAEVTQPPGDFPPVKVYLASEQGFRNYCETCPMLALVQETGFQVFEFRVFCTVEKCQCSQTK